jgi:hypothetical protein
MLVKEDKLIPMDEAIKNGEITGKSIEHAEKMQKALSDDNAEEFFEAVDKFNEAENKKETLEVVNGDPAVLDEKEELNAEAIRDEENHEARPVIDASQMVNQPAEEAQAEEVKEEQPEDKPDF